MINVVIR